jgi:hypothetical protein
MKSAERCPMNLDYETSRARPWLIDLNSRTLLLRSLLVYCVLSILTLPFIDSLWLGEIPVIALVQVPKTFFAGWLRTDVVMPLIRTLGLSRGSFSPDYSLARPYALAIAYLLPLAIVFAFVRLRGEAARRYRLWSLALLLAAAIDFCLTLLLAGGPGLSIY